MDIYLVKFPVQEVATPRVQNAWFNAALDYLKQTGDADGWRVMMYGA